MRSFISNLILTILLALTIPLSGQEYKVDHSIWNQLLNTYVDQQGMVDYRGMAHVKPKLDQYLANLSSHLPDESWKENEKLAYWINAYNAYTISLILAHYPLKSIMDIDKAWDQQFIHIGKKQYSLNQIEHEIIRKKFSEPRIHFVLVCAAVSCPALLNTAYDPAQLDQQLQQQALQFINNNSKNSISKKKIKVSQVFNWFKEDFTKDATLVDYLNRFSNLQIDPDASVEFMDYDWRLNEQEKN